MDANDAKPQVTRECVLCDFVTDEAVVVCPHDGSALVTCQPDPLIGITIAGRYEILSLVGEGSMANVYKAKDKSFERVVAIKVMRNERLNKEGILRFQQEARAVARLNHANIVSCFDFGLTHDNVPFLAMEYVEGASLLDRLHEGVLSVDEFVPIFAQACDALDHAHQNGIVHRDIKPSNIMLVGGSGAQVRVKVLDFGIAKLLPSFNSAHAAALTQTGELFGSPQYMSPEQFSGDTMDGRSDIYSLGCVMYEALVGKPPMQGPGILELVHQHTYERPASFKSTASGIPQQLEALVFKAMEKNPSHRFPSMAALKHNLEFLSRFAAEEQLADESAAPNDKHSRGSARSIAVIIALIVVVGLTAVAVSGALQGEAEPSLENVVLKVKLKLAQTIGPSDSGLVISSLCGLRDSYARRGNAKLALLYANDVLQQLGKKGVDDWAYIQQVICLAELKERFQQDATRQYQSAYDKLTRLAEKNRQQKSWGLNNAPDQPIDQTLITLEQKLKAADDPLAADGKIAQASDLLKQGNLQVAEESADQLSKVHGTLSKAQNIRLAGLINELADAQDVSTEKAESYYTKAVAILDESVGQRSWEAVEARRKLALYYEKCKDYTKAENAMLDALAAANEAGFNELASKAYNDLGEHYRDTKEFDKAAEMFKLADKVK